MLSVCRICLAGNTSLSSVKNKQLIYCYEKLTNAKLNSEDARPTALCCFCYQKLLKCHNFSEMALRSESILSHLYDRGLEVTHEYITEVTIKHHLSVTTTQLSLNDHNATIAGSEVTIKEEPLHSIDMKEQVTLKPDKLVNIDSFSDGHRTSHLNFEEHFSDEENNTEDLCSYTHIDKTKPDDTSCSIKDEPLSSIDIKENITTELDKLVEAEPFLEQSTRSRLTFQEDNSDQEEDVENLLHKIRIEQAKLDNSKIPFSCKYCKKIFDLKSKLISHIRKSHSQLTGKQYSSTEKHTETTSMIENKTIHNQKQKLACHVCAKQFRTKGAVVIHMRSHTGEKPFACNVCDKQFNRKNGVVRHMRIHVLSGRVNLTPGDRDTIKSHLVSHMRIHTGEKPFACNVCDKCFSRKGNLVVHMRTHTGEKPFACNVCIKQFIIKSHLVSHMRIHTGEKPFACNVCDKKFNQKNGLVRHMRIHTGEKPFACSICVKQFIEKSQFISHMRIHTGEKPFACNVCDKGFSRKGNLVVHMRTHTGEKPFACNVCIKQFIIKSHLVSHMRIHTGEKPFACNVCYKQFNRKNGLVRHMRIHTGEKPFACNVCNKQFNRKNGVVKHMRIHILSGRVNLTPGDRDRARDKCISDRWKDKDDK